MPIRPAPGAPSVLILNSGGVPRSGHGRLSVKLARALAADGVASFRVDVGGNGDTRPVLRTANTEPYHARRADDVRVALDWMAGAGWDKVVGFGLCSGGYLALHGAMADRRMAGGVFVNVQSFLWPKGKPVDAVANRTIRQVESYFSRLRDPAAWRGLLRGEFGIGGKALGIGRHYAARAAAGVQRHLPPPLAVAPRLGRIQRLFAGLAARDVPLLFVYSEGDPGINELQVVFGRGGRRLTAQGGPAVRFLPGTDHTLTDAASKDALVALVRQYLATNFPPPPPETVGAKHQVERALM